MSSKYFSEYWIWPIYHCVIFVFQRELHHDEADSMVSIAEVKQRMNSKLKLS